MEQLTVRPSEISTKKTLVSVVLPTKNRANFLIEAVRSIFASSYQYFELIVVDQTDDDSTQKVLEEFAAESRLRYCRNEKKGASSSRNLGAALSRGDIIAFTDDDVTVTPDWLQRIVTAFEADPELQFICGKLTAPPFDPNAGLIPSFDPEESAASAWQLSTTVGSANFSVRRELMFQRIGGYDESTSPGTAIGSGEDVNFLMRVIASGAKYKSDSKIEVIHTNGFRAGAVMEKAIRNYQIGAGYAYGRGLRRGQLKPAFWFLQSQSSEIIRHGLLRLLCGQRPVRMGWVRNRCIGFWRGFWEDPNLGYVGPSQLTQLVTTKNSSI